MSTPPTAKRLDKNTFVLAQRLTAVYSGDTLLLTSEDGAVALRGKIYVDLARSLAQGVTWEELQRRFGKTYPEHELVAKLQEFLDGGLTGVSGVKPRAEAAFWEEI